MAAGADKTPPATAKAHLSIRLTTSSPTISLSNETPERPFQLILTTTIVSSSKADTAITICTDGSVLDNGQNSSHDGLFRGAFLALESTADPKRRINLRWPGSPNYGSAPHADPDCRKRPWMHFETIPPSGSLPLVIKHDLPLSRIFKNSSGPKTSQEVQPGETFRVRMDPKRLFWTGWWTFGDLEQELKEKKFAEWERPREDGGYQ